MINQRHEGRCRGHGRNLHGIHGTVSKQINTLQIGRISAMPEHAVRVKPPFVGELNLVGFFRSRRQQRPLAVCPQPN